VSSRPRTFRSAVRVLSGLLFVVGLLMVAHTVVTLVWQEPFTRGTAKAAQKRARLRLDDPTLERLQPAELVRVSRVTGDRNQIAYLANRLERRTLAGEALGSVRIPRIDASFAFMRGTGTEALKRGPGHYAGTVLPGQPGTVGIAGHRTTYLAPFRKLNELKRGDTVELRMPYGTFTYAVEGTVIVDPEKTEVLRTVKHDRVVLTACHPLSSSAQRIVVSARLVRSKTKAARLQVLGDGSVLAALPALAEMPQRLPVRLAPLTTNPHFGGSV